MNYRLIVVTHGDNAECLERTIVSFSEMVTPAPAERILIQDGPCVMAPVEPLGAWWGYVSPHTEGFCKAMRRAWWMGATGDAGIKYTFLLEHDFVFRRPVNLNDLAVILGDPGLAQVALMRQPLNREPDGIVPEAERDYKTRSGRRWVEHNRYFTTNPSLMRVGFMRENPWPADGPECEGRYGAALRERGYRFAYMGTGEPWVEHIGVRNGKGY